MELTIQYKNKLYKIRKAIENKKQWVVDVFYDKRPYPNIVSGRFTTKKLAREAVRKDIVNSSKDFYFSGNV